MSNQSIAQRQAEIETTRDEEFNRWLSREEVKLMLSMLPKTDPPETVSSILRYAYRAGWDTGAGEIAIEVVKQMMSKPEQRR